MKNSYSVVKWAGFGWHLKSCHFPKIPMLKTSKNCTFGSKFFKCSPKTKPLHVWFLDESGIQELGFQTPPPPRVCLKYLKWKFCTSYQFFSLKNVLSVLPAWNSVWVDKYLWTWIQRYFIYLCHPPAIFTVFPFHRTLWSMSRKRLSGKRLV